MLAFAARFRQQEQVCPAAHNRCSTLTSFTSVLFKFDQQSESEDLDFRMRSRNHHQAWLLTLVPGRGWEREQQERRYRARLGATSAKVPANAGCNRLQQVVRVGLWCSHFSSLCWMFASFATRDSRATLVRRMRGEAADFGRRRAVPRGCGSSWVSSGEPLASHHSPAGRSSSLVADQWRIQRGATWTLEPLGSHAKRHPSARPSSQAKASALQPGASRVAPESRLIPCREEAWRAGVPRIELFERFRNASEESDAVPRVPSPYPNFAAGAPSPPTSELSKKRVRQVRGTARHCASVQPGRASIQFATLPDGKLGAMRWKTLDHSESATPPNSRESHLHVLLYTRASTCFACPGDADGTLGMAH